MGLEFAGKHRGIVVDNNDPSKLGRVKVRVDAAYGNQATDLLPWAYPCLNQGGSKDLGLYAIPEIGAGVWVEFQWENGEPNTDYPLIVGTWLADGETPRQVEGDPKDAHKYKVWKTTSGHVLTFCDKEGEEFIRLEHGKTGAVWELLPNGDINITAPNGDINISASDDVIIEGARIDLN